MHVGEREGRLRGEERRGRSKDSGPGSGNGIAATRPGTENTRRLGVQVAIPRETIDREKQRKTPHL